METFEMELKLLSPCFCGGADQDAPEIRAPSIRGHLRRWHQRLYLSEEDMKTVWGSVGGKAGASKIQLRVEAFDFQKKKNPLLPHKQNGAGSRSALEGGTFNVLLASRDAAALKKAAKVLELWSVLGSLGTRANRAAGSVWPTDASPGNLTEFKNRLETLGFSCCGMYVSKGMGTAEQLRKAASDTLSIPELFGSAKPAREESPVKIKLIELADGLHLIMFAGQPGKVEDALQELRKKNKPLGQMEWDVVFGLGR